MRILSLTNTKNYQFSAQKSGKYSNWIFLELTEFFMTFKEHPSGILSNFMTKNCNKSFNANQALILFFKKIRSSHFKDSKLFQPSKNYTSNLIDSRLRSSTKAQSFFPSSFRLSLFSSDSNNNLTKETKKKQHEENLQTKWKCQKEEEKGTKKRFSSFLHDFGFYFFFGFANGKRSSFRKHTEHSNSFTSFSSASVSLSHTYYSFFFLLFLSYIHTSTKKVNKCEDGTSTSHRVHTRRSKRERVCEYERRSDAKERKGNVEGEWVAKGHLEDDWEISFFFPFALLISYKLSIMPCGWSFFISKNKYVCAGSVNSENFFPFLTRCESLRANSMLCGRTSWVSWATHGTDWEVERNWEFL